MATYSIFTFNVIHIPCNRLTIQYSVHLIANASINACYTVIVLLRVSAPEYCSIKLIVIVQTAAHNTSMVLTLNEGDCSDMDVCLQLSIKLLRNFKVHVVGPHIIQFSNILSDNTIF